MAPDPPFLLPLLLHFLLFSTTTTPLPPALSPPSTTTPPHNITPPTAPSPTPSPSPRTPSRPSSPISNSPLDPKQRAALESLNLPFKDPCSPVHNSTTICDSSTPFRHLISLKLSNCSDDVALSLTALKSLSTLKDLQFINCPISPIRFPAELTSNLRSFTCIKSLKKLSSVWLTRLQNLTELTVSNVAVRASGPAVILNSLKNLRSATISHANLTGYLPKHFHPNITYLDLSANQLKGKIPTSLTSLENLIHLNLSSNALQGEIPESFGDLNALQNVSLASNSLSGSIPDTLVAIPGLIHLDLGSNQLNGTIPRFLSNMKSLKYLNLEKNSFHGVLPFNASFIKRLDVFKIGENSNLCYIHSTLSSKVKLGIAQCDKHGLPMSPPPAKDSSGDLSSEDDYSEEDDDVEKNQGHHSGPNKVILGIAIGLASIVFLIVFLVLLSKCCK